MDRQSKKVYLMLFLSRLKKTINIIRELRKRRRKNLSCFLVNKITFYLFMCLFKCEILNNTIKVCLIIMWLTWLMPMKLVINLALCFFSFAVMITTYVFLFFSFNITLKIYTKDYCFQQLFKVFCSSRSILGFCICVLGQCVNYKSLNFQFA